MPSHVLRFYITIAVIFGLTSIKSQTRVINLVISEDRKIKPKKEAHYQFGNFPEIGNFLVRTFHATHLSKFNLEKLKFSS